MDIYSKKRRKKTKKKSIRLVSDHERKKKFVCKLNFDCVIYLKSHERLSIDETQVPLHTDGLTVNDLMIEIQFRDKQIQQQLCQSIQWLKNTVNKLCPNSSVIVLCDRLKL